MSLDQAAPALGRLFPKDDAMNLPRYQSHKIVQAAKVVAVSSDDAQDVNVALNLQLDDQTIVAHPVTTDWMRRNVPPNTQWDVLIGGYFVRYEDGYESWSPASAFEKGYTKLDDENPPEGAA